MNQPHKWAEAIKAWADGKEIQFRTIRGTWYSFGETERASPAFNRRILEWRVKPEPVPDEVYYDVIRTCRSPEGKEKHNEYVYRNLQQLQRAWPDQMYVKLTIKTDENGRETQHVELVD